LLDKKETTQGKKLYAFLRLSNIYVGDAIANLLMIEAILRDKGMNIAEFNELYRDLPSQMFKIKVANRALF
jgi:phosphoacetylglucosamine mutase